MPIYEVELSDGRVFEVESDTPPSEADVMRQLGGSAPSGGMSTGAKVAGGVGLAALLGMGAKAAQAPGIMGKVGAFAGQLNALRQQAMLSGFALPKSILGGVGGTVANAIERRSMAPLKELLSGQTVRDVGTAFKQGRQVGPVGAHGAELPFGLDAPGRAMGAVDDAIRNALVRSGASTDDATAAMLQTPLPFENKMSGKAAKYFFPFRRTPFNQFFEGLEAMEKHPAISAGYGAAGVVQGAAESDEQYPVGAGLGIAASGKYGFPQGVGQGIGRMLAGGKGGGGIGGSVLPVSEYGLTQGISEPLRPFEKPAFITMLEKLGLKPRQR